MAADTYVVERSIHVDAPPADVYERVVDFHQLAGVVPVGGARPGDGAHLRGSGVR